MSPKEIFGQQLGKKQAGAELCQAQVKIEVVVVVEFRVEVETCHY